MKIKNAKYDSARKSVILANVDDVDVSIPLDPANRHYEEILRQEITIADYVAPAETMESIRGKRNQLLRDTDWQGMSDVTMSDAQKAYRQKLRDLPATNADPTKIVFPDAP